MDWITVVILAGAAAAGFAQGVSGFAFSLVALSIWAWAIAPQLAGPMAVFGALAGQVVALPWVWRGFDLKLLMPLAIGGVIGVPFGIMVLPYLDPELFRLVLGAFLLVYSPLALLLPQDYRLEAGGRPADMAAGFVGGVLGGIGGMAGAIPTLWTTLRGYSKDAQRGVMQAFNIAMHTATLTGYLIAGTLDRQTLGMFALIAPAIVIPAILGVQLFLRLQLRSFRRLVLGFLFLSGLLLVAGSIGPVLQAL
jgi:uncharacterized membrane protein YfcA